MKPQRNNAVSPVIGALLLTALVVGLVSVASITVFDVLESQQQTTDNVELRTTSFEQYTEVELLRISAPVTVQYENGTDVSYENETSLRIPENTTATIVTNDVFVQEINADATGNQTQSTLAWRTADDWDDGNVTTSQMIHSESGSFPANTIRPASRLKIDNGANEEVKLLYEYERYTDNENTVFDTSNENKPGIPVNDGTGNRTFTTESYSGFGDVGDYYPGSDGLSESRVIVENGTELESQIVGNHTVMTWVRPDRLSYLEARDERRDNATLLGGYDNDRVWQRDCTVTENYDGSSDSPGKPGGPRPAAGAPFNNNDTCKAGFTDNGILDASIGPEGRLGGGFYQAANDRLAYTRSDLSDTVPIDEWSLITVLWDGTTDGDGDEIQGYIDDKRVFTTAVNANPADDSGERYHPDGELPLYLGGEVDPFDPDTTGVDVDDGFDGDMDGTRIYNRTLTPDDVEETYNTSGVYRYASSIKSVTNTSLPSTLSVKMRKNGDFLDEQVSVSIVGSPGRVDKEVVQHRSNFVNGGTQPVNADRFNQSHQLYRIRLTIDSGRQPNTFPVVDKIRLGFDGSDSIESRPSPSPPEDNCATLASMDGSGTDADPYIVTTDQELQSIRCEPSSSYKLGGDISASRTDEWNGGNGFKPIGRGTNEFEGTIDGDGHTVRGLSIARANSGRIGVFGAVVGDGIVKDIQFTDVDITGGDITGGLVGLNLATVRDSSASGGVSGQNNTGGLIGLNTGDINDSYFSGSVTGNNDVGGLVGDNDETSPSVISRSYAIGSVFGDDNSGGLVGVNEENSEIKATFAAVRVTGDSSTGGLVGRNSDSATVSGSYYDTESTTQESGIGTGSGDVVGLSTSEMQGETPAPTGSNTMDDFNFDNNWRTVTGPPDYPELQE